MAESNATASGNSPTTTAQSLVHLPRIAIKFCTQCKWNLRAAYYAQELLQTFSTSLGEVALIPTSGGIFTITLFHTPTPSSSHTTAIDAQSTSETKTADDMDPSSVSVATRTEEVLVVQETLLWDRKTEGGFPETKELKSRVRNVIQPNRHLGHVDRSLKKAKVSAEAEAEGEKSKEEVVAEESAEEVMAEEKVEGGMTYL